MPSVYKNQISLRNFKKFSSDLLNHEKKDLWILVLYGVWVSICSLVIPIAVQTFVNTIGFGLLLQPIVILTLIVLSVLGFSSVIRCMQLYLAEILQQRLFARTAMRLAHHIPKVEHQSLKTNHGAEWVNRFFDVTTIQKTLISVVLDGIEVILQVFAGMILLAFYHPFLLALNLFILVVVFVFYFGLASRAIESSILESKAKYAVVGWIQDLARNSNTFRTPDSRKYAATKTDQLTHGYLVQRKKHFSILFKQILAATVLQVIVSTLLLGVGGWLVISEQLTLGQLVASELIVTFVVAGIGKFGKYLESYYDYAAASDKLGELFGLPTEKESQECLADSAAKNLVLNIKNLRFDRDSSNLSSPAIHLGLMPGTKLGIVGPSGSGKTRFAHLCYGLEQPGSGAIEIDGLDLRYSSLEYIRSSTSLVSGIQLYDGTLLDNIRIHKLDASIHSVQRLLIDFGLDELITTLPDGLHTEIRGGQHPLSTIQARKIMMIRALVSNPKLVILDDLIEEIDFGQDRHVMKYFSRPNLPFAVVFTARSPSSVSFCDQVYSLEHGMLNPETLREPSWK